MSREGPAMRPSRRRIGLRWRITIAFLSGTLAVSALVAATTYFLADRYLSRQRVDDSIEQGLANIGFATRYLSSPQTVEIGTDASLPQLVDLLEARGVSEALLVTDEGEAFTSSFSITLQSVPERLLQSVRGGQVGYSVSASQPRRLVFGSPVPGHDLTAYFFFPLADLDQTLLILSRVLIGVSLGAALLAALVGTRVSRRVVDPVRRVSDAARKVAEGLLETRLQMGGGDELGGLASSFNEMAAALEDRIARERRFVGDVSHELRTPLTTLRASTDYLLEHAESLSPPVRRATELLAADLTYLQRLVDDLLDLSRVEAGRVQMSWERLSLADLAREVVSRRARLEGQDIRVELEAEPEELVTVADKQRLERVVGNLVDNALIHGQGKDVVVRLGAQDGSLLLSVEDRGPGVPPNLGQRIFERFVKADPARQREEGRGSGLGLAIARENASLHDGEITAFNGHDGGARFTLRLPRREQEVEA